MSITDGTRGVTRVNGTDQAVKMVKVSETDDEEVYDLEPEEPEQPVDQPDPRPLADTRGIEARRPILPTGISANAVLRLCLKVMGQIENDMVLGTSSYKAGVRATMFTRSDVGICYIASEGDDPRITRAHYVNAPDAVRVVERAHKVRKADNRLSGYALGHAPADLGPSFDLLADILAVVAADEEKVWNERVATRLGQLRPDAYGGWTTENVTLALKPFGVPVKDVAGTTDEGARTTRRGIERAAIVAAINERNRAK